MNKLNINIKKFFDLKWILFLGVLPIDKAALTLYRSNTTGELISFILEVITLIMAFIGFFNIRTIKVKYHLCQKYILYFVVLIITYLFAASVDQILITRFLSLGCLLGYYLFVICCYNNIDQFLRDINKALLFVIIVGSILYLLKNDNVMYIENANSTVFKGIAANRNTYSEFSLFYIATNFYLIRQDKKGILWRVVTTVLAVYTTVLTHGATSIICLFLLLLLLICRNRKWVHKMLSFKLLMLVYLTVFVIVVWHQNTQWNLIEYITVLFGKTTSFTGRTDIWTVAIKSISKSPIWGLGYDTSILLKQGFVVNDPHNSLLYIALTQGIVGIISLGVMLMFIVKNDSNVKLKSDNAYITMMVFVIVWFLRGLVESAFSYAHFVFWCAIIVMELSLRNMQQQP